jgi:hypothetical protein
MQVQVSTTQFEFCHSRRPRGEGTWAFFFDGEDDASKAWWFTGSYGEARRAAVAYAKEHGYRSVQVGS